MPYNAHYARSGYIELRSSVRDELVRRQQMLGAADFSDTISRLLHPTTPPTSAPRGPEPAGPAPRAPPAQPGVEWARPAVCGKASKDGAFHCRIGNADHEGLCETWGRGGKRRFKGAVP